MPQKIINKFLDEQHPLAVNAAYKGNVSLFSSIIDDMNEFIAKAASKSTTELESELEPELIADKFIEKFLNTPDENGYTLLMIAASYGYDLMLSHLIQRKASINLSTEDNKTALIYAIENGSVESVKLLLKHKADININYPLNIAVRLGQLDIVEQLLINAQLYDTKTNFVNTFVNGLDNFGKPPLFYALKNADFKMLELLSNYTVDLTTPICTNKEHATYSHLMPLAFTRLLKLQKPELAAKYLEIEAYLQEMQTTKSIPYEAIINLLDRLINMTRASSQRYKHLSQMNDWFICRKPENYEVQMRFLNVLSCLCAQSQCFSFFKKIDLIEFQKWTALYCPEEEFIQIPFSNEDEFKQSFRFIATCVSLPSSRNLLCDQEHDRTSPQSVAENYNFF